MMAVSVPKRLFKRAVDRNLLKRRIREAYRLRKPDFYSDLGSKSIWIQMVIQYRGRSIADYQTIEESLGRALGKVMKSVSARLSDDGAPSQSV